MKNRLLYALLSLVALATTAATASAQLVTYLVQIESATDQSSYGFAAGDRFDLTFTIDFSAPGTINDTDFYYSPNAIANATISMASAPGNQGSWNAATTVFFSNTLYAVSGFSSDQLILTAAGGAASQPALGYAFAGLTLTLTSTGDLGLINPHGSPTGAALSSYMNPVALLQFDAAAFQLQLSTESGNIFRPFDVVSITSAIPEPSTYAALFGALVLGLAVYRRRKEAA